MLVLRQTHRRLPGRRTIHERQGRGWRGAEDQRETQTSRDCTSRGSGVARLSHDYRIGCPSPASLPLVARRRRTSNPQLTQVKGTGASRLCRERAQSCPLEWNVMVQHGHDCLPPCRAPDRPRGSEAEPRKR
jgi:hypothetical protein